MKIQTVYVAKKGKGVKGVYQEVKAFGTPVREKNAKKTDPVSEFNYDFVDDLELKAIDDAIEQQSGLSLRLIKEARVRGIDYVLRHESVQANAELASIVSWIMEKDLAETKEQAKPVAENWLKSILANRSAMAPAHSLETYAKPLQKWVNEQKAKGVWKTTLVKTEAEKTEAAKPEAESK